MFDMSLYRKIACMLLLTIAQTAFADVIVPYSRDLRACLKLNGSALSSQAEQALKLLMTQPTENKLGELIQLSTVPDPNQSFSVVWARLKEVSRQVETTRPGTIITYHLTQFDRAVPRANVDRDLCAPGEIQVNLIRTGHRPWIEKVNPCTPGEVSFCNLVCDGDECKFQIQSPGSPAVRKFDEKERVKFIDACLPTLNGKLTPEGVQKVDFLLSVDPVPDYREEVLLGLVSSASDPHVEWNGMTELLQTARTRRTLVGAASVNVTAGQKMWGGQRFSNFCPDGQISLRLSLVGNSSIRMPCLHFGSCTVTCAGDRCSFSH